MEKVSAILAGLGGIDNVVEIEPCTTRLRAEVSNPDLVSVPNLRTLGVHGVMMSGRVVQIVIGPEVDLLASDLQDLMWAERAEPAAQDQ